MNIAEKIARAKADLDSVYDAGVEKGRGEATDGVTVEPLEVTSNGTYTAPDGVAYSPVKVNVPDVNGSYDEGYEDGYEKGKAEGAPEDLNDVLAAQEEKLAELSAILDKKAEGGGKVAIEEKEVNFYDYDGTLLYSYTLEEAQALTELPPLPDWHKYLIPDVWTYSLEDVTTLTQRADIGALYNTVDNAVYVGINIIDMSNATIVLNFSGTNVVADWGDNTAKETISTGASHTYGTTGKYVIKLTGVTQLGGGTNSTQFLSGNGCKTMTFLFSGSTAALMAHGLYKCTSLECVSIRNVRFDATYSYRECRRLHFVVYPNSEINYGQFYDCTSLEMICPQKAKTYIHGEAFRACSSLRRFTKPDYKITDGSYHFYYCHSIDSVDIRNDCPDMVAYSCYVARRITIHEGVTSIGSQAVYNCYATEIFSIASTVTNIAAQAFCHCGGARRIKFLPSTPPTVANANAFTGIPADCVVEVPATSLEAYKAATNYGSIAAQMIGV